MLQIEASQLLAVEQHDLALVVADKTEDTEVVLHAYLEWGTRLAVINSQPGAQAVEDAPMPAWGWGETKGPYRP